MKSEVQGTVGGSREGLALVGAERQRRQTRPGGSRQQKWRTQASHSSGRSSAESSSGLVVRSAQHHLHLKLHVRRPNNSKCTHLTINLYLLPCGLRIGRILHYTLQRIPQAPCLPRRPPEYYRTESPKPTMISDNDLYRLAIFLGSAAMVLIILYHYVEVNKEEEQPAKTVQPGKPAKAVS
ncbi:oligosaccaryltransferase [Colletotrichum tofieldiae]|uniref:Dolichyl-diphosphooligosaccharide--protein glycosyltransferase subunit 4 n=1 Tax=Colletotrichum tofieldiae TaxID=708197 RepID=A0A161VVU5_9PEZI|nr:oligosaccaryltransferase [Colletotrichum tofieldiae]